MAQSIVSTGGVRLNGRTKCYAQKIHARKVGIDKQGVASGFELVTVCAEKSHTHAVARSCARVAYNELCVRRQSGSETLRGQCE